MSDYELIRRDSEYQKEIRRRKMTDAAKIGLLVAQNVQQFQTNQILAQVHSEACRTNQFLGHMASTLDQIAQMQATHFEQVQKERELKEVMFQFEKFLNETEEFGDPISVAFGTKRLFEILDRPRNGFSTADLTDLSDKKHFDGLVARAKGLLTGLPRHQFEELEQFERLLGVYYQRKATGFDADRAFPKKKHAKLPKEFRKQPPTKQPVTSSGATALAFVGGGCGVIMCGFGLLFLLVTISMLVQREPNALGGSVCILPFLGIGSLLVWNLFRQRNADKKAELEHQAQRQDHLNSWDANRKREEAKLAQQNQNIDSENAKIEEKRRQATKLFQATMDEMRSLINGFLNQHPPIQKFVARV
ncbi:hypothetical protein GC197_16150 [bacterium]|nr:hypothetical protein [bacterium]